MTTETLNSMDNKTSNYINESRETENNVNENQAIRGWKVVDF